MTVPFRSVPQNTNGLTKLMVHDLSLKRYNLAKSYRQFHVAYYYLALYLLPLLCSAYYQKSVSHAVMSGIYNLFIFIFDLM